MRNPPKAYVVLEVAEPFEVLDAALNEHLGRCDGTGTTRRDELTTGSVRYPLGHNAQWGAIVLRKSKGNTSILRLEEVAAAWRDQEADVGERTEESVRTYLKRLDFALKQQARAIRCFLRRLDDDPACAGQTDWDKLKEALDELRARCSPPLLRQLEGKPPRRPGPYIPPRFHRDAETLRDWNQPFAVSAPKEPITPQRTEPDRSEEELSVYAFNRSGSIWTIAYEGEEFQLHDLDGLGCLHALLARPNHSMRALELELAVEGIASGELIGEEDREWLPGVVNGGYNQDKVDEQTIKQCEATLEQLKQQRSEIEVRRDPAEINRLNDRIDNLERHLKEVQGIGGRRRKFLDALEGSRTRVWHKIHTAYAAIEKHNPSLAEYLKAHIKTGTQCRYEVDPCNELPWRL